MGFRRAFFASLFLVLCVSAINAYTVVMRDGRKVEIPNAFTVTSSTLTYEVSKGFHVTIQLNTVDIAATERANGAAPGSLLMKANAPNASVPQTRANAQRSITNADLEKYRTARVNSEKEYEERRKELGLPSLEERRREAAEITERNVEHARSLREQEEAYWRSRADALRAEMTMRQAQFDSSRQRSEDVIFSSSLGGFPAFGPFDGIGFGVTDGHFGRFGHFSSSPFDGFLATPITPFPRFPSFRRHGPRAVLNPRVRFNPRPGHGRPGHGGHGRRR